MTREEFVKKAKEFGYTNAEILRMIKLIEETTGKYEDYILLSKPKTK